MHCHFNSGATQSGKELQVVTARLQHAKEEIQPCHMLVSVNCAVSENS
jgi:hypothetical protein